MLMWHTETHLCRIQGSCARVMCCHLLVLEDRVTQKRRLVMSDVSYCLQPSDVVSLRDADHSHIVNALTCHADASHSLPDTTTHTVVWYVGSGHALRHNDIQQFMSRVSHRRCVRIVLDWTRSLPDMKDALHPDAHIISACSSDPGAFTQSIVDIVHMDSTIAQTASSMILAARVLLHERHTPSQIIMQTSASRLKLNGPFLNMAAKPPRVQEDDETRKGELATTGICVARI